MTAPPKPPTRPSLSMLSRDTLERLAAGERRMPKAFAVLCPKCGRTLR